jgi:hypothetical protein
MNILPLFFEIDEFCRFFEPLWNQHLIAQSRKQRNRRRSLALSEVMTIMVLFHQSGYRNLKQFYLGFVCQYLDSEFPALVSYNRFVEFERDALVPLSAYLQTRRGKCSGISFIDSTKLAVCENLRIPQPRQFTGRAARGKTTLGWFYGFKLHVTVSDCGELLAWQVTPGNIDDRRPVEKLTQRLFGKLFGDLGYLSEPLKMLLREQHLELITKVKKNMKNQFLNLSDKLFLRKRAIIRISVRSVEKHFANRTHQTSLVLELFGQSRIRLDCLQLARKETFVKLRCKCTCLLVLIPN